MTSTNSVNYLLLGTLEETGFSLSPVLEPLVLLESREVNDLDGLVQLA